MSIYLTTPVRDWIINAVAPRLNTVRIYGGAIPATPGAAPGGPILAEFVVALPQAVNGTSWLEVPIAVACAVSGTATWARWSENASDSVCIDGVVGTSSAAFVLDNLTLSAGVNVSLMSLRLSQPAS